MGFLDDNANSCDRGHFVVWKKKGMSIAAVLFDSNLWEDMKTN